MKLRNLFLASVACAGLFTACSNEVDEVIDNGGNGVENAGEAYASFAIQFPSAAGTRAAAQEVGTTEENTVKDVTLLFFDASNKNLADIKVIPVANLERNAATYTAKDLVVTKGSREIYAFVNAQPAIKAFSPNDNGKAHSVITGIGTETAASMSGANGFTMSNTETVSATNVTYTTKEEANQNAITIKVERTVAKVQYTGNNFAFDIKRADGAKTGTVTLTDMELINKNDKYFYLRRVSANVDGSGFVIGGAEIDGTNYVVDPNFTEKNPTGTAWGKESKTIAQDATFYCLENTMTAEAQYNVVTTGAMFKAKFVIAGGQADENIYRYNGVLYNKEADVKTAANITENTTGWTIGQWAAKSVTFYAGGICYYPYWIKHIDNSNPTVMGTMEFGVVRNNVYKLAVTSIKEIGAPTDEVDPETPDEVLSTYLSVKVEVKEWTVRPNQGIEL